MAKDKDSIEPITPAAAPVVAAPVASDPTPVAGGVTPADESGNFVFHVMLNETDLQVSARDEVEAWAKFCDAYALRLGPHTPGKLVVQV